MDMSHQKLNQVARSSACSSPQSLPSPGEFQSKERSSTGTPSYPSMASPMEVQPKEQLNGPASPWNTSQSLSAATSQYMLQWGTASLEAAVRPNEPRSSSVKSASALLHAPRTVVADNASYHSSAVAAAAMEASYHRPFLDSPQHSPGVQHHHPHAAQLSLAMQPAAFHGQHHPPAFTHGLHHQHHQRSPSAFHDNSNRLDLSVASHGLGTGLAGGAHQHVPPAFHRGYHHGALLSSSASSRHPGLGAPNNNHNAGLNAHVLNMHHTGHNNPSRQGSSFHSPDMHQAHHSPDVHRGHLSPALDYSQHAAQQQPLDATQNNQSLESNQPSVDSSSQHGFRASLPTSSIDEAHHTTSLTSSQASSTMDNDHHSQHSQTADNSQQPSSIDASSQQVPVMTSTSMQTTSLDNNQGASSMSNSPDNYQPASSVSGPSDLTMDSTKLQVQKSELQLAKKRKACDSQLENCSSGNQQLFSTDLDDCQFRCLLCNIEKEFTYVNMRSHILASHGEIKILKGTTYTCSKQVFHRCKLCGKQMLSVRQNVCQHLRSSHGITQIKIYRDMSASELLKFQEQAGPVLKMKKMTKIEMDMNGPGGQHSGALYPVKSTSEDTNENEMASCIKHEKMEDNENDPSGSHETILSFGSQTGTDGEKRKKKPRGPVRGFSQSLRTRIGIRCCQNDGCKDGQLCGTQFSSLVDECLFRCLLCQCDKDFKYATIRNHMRQSHADAKFIKGRSYTYSKMIFHKCKICGKHLKSILNHVWQHLRNTHTIKFGDYKRMTFSQLKETENQEQDGRETESSMEKKGNFEAKDANTGGDRHHHSGLVDQLANVAKRPPSPCDNEDVILSNQTNDSTFSCNLCDQAREYKYCSLVPHMKIHKVQMVKDVTYRCRKTVVHRCKICGTRIPSIAQNVRQHVVRMHKLNMSEYLYLKVEEGDSARNRSSMENEKSCQTDGVVKPPVRSSKRPKASSGKLSPNSRQKTANFDDEFLKEMYLASDQDMIDVMAFLELENGETNKHMSQPKSEPEELPSTDDMVGGMSMSGEPADEHAGEGDSFHRDVKSAPE